MSVFKKLKKITGGLKGVFMRRMMKDTGIAHFKPNGDRGNQAQIRKILISRPNHRLGNLLLITPLLQEVIETFPDAEIDLFVKGNLAPSLFKNYTNIHRIISLPKKPLKALFNYLQGWIVMKKSRYDIVINAIDQSSSGILSIRFATSRYAFYGDLEDQTKLKYKDHVHMAKYAVYSFRNYLYKIGIEKSETPAPHLDLQLSASELAEGKKNLYELVKNEKETIGLFTYATGAKCYPPLWWNEFYNQLITNYPEYNIIEVLPVEHVSQISFKAPTYSSKDVRQAGALIANTCIFIVADGGVMHLASSVQTPTIGLFKVTNPDSYTPYNNGSVAINTNDLDLTDCIRIVGEVLNKSKSIEVVTDSSPLRTAP